MSINATLFVQAIFFLILVWFTMTFVWPTIAKALDERAQKIADGLAAADRARTELAAADQRVKQELAAASNETANRLADAERRAQAIIEEAKARATEEGNKIVAAARAEAEQQAIAAREALREQVAALAVKANPQLRQLLDNPKVTAEQLFDVITGVAKTALPEMAHNFLRTLLDNGRVQVLPEIATQFRALVNQGNGSSDAVVYSAFPLDANALAELSATLHKRFARTLNLSVQTDESLIGGVRVVVGDEVLDTSVKARLEQMKAALTA